MISILNFWSQYKLLPISDIWAVVLQNHIPLVSSVIKWKRGISHIPLLCVYSAGLGRGLNFNFSIFCRSGALHVNKLLFWGAPKPQCRALTSTKVSGAEEPAANLAPHLALVRLQWEKARPGRGRDYLQSWAKCAATFGLAFGLLSVYSAGSAAARPRPGPAFLAL